MLVVLVLPIHILLFWNTNCNSQTPLSLFTRTKTRTNERTNVVMVSKMMETEEGDEKKSKTPPTKKKSVLERLEPTKTKHSSVRKGNQQNRHSSPTTFYNNNSNNRGARGRGRAGVVVWGLPTSSLWARVRPSIICTAPSTIR